MHAAVVSLVLLVGQAANDSADDRGLVEAWLKVSLDHAKAYHITPQGQPDASFKLLPKPIFRHSQPVRGDDIGAVYLWVSDDGRPAVIGTVFAYSAGEGARWVAHEVHSLSDQPLTARWQEETIWAPDRRGVDWRPIPEAPSPGCWILTNNALPSGLWAMPVTSQPTRPTSIRLIRTSPPAWLPLVLATSI